MSMQDIGQVIHRERHTQDSAYSGQGLLRTQDMAYTGHRTGHTQDRAYSGHRTEHTQDTGQGILRTGQDSLQPVSQLEQIALLDACQHDAVVRSDILAGNV